jgi:hypothetical protein
MGSRWPSSLADEATIAIADAAANTGIDLRTSVASAAHAAARRHVRAILFDVAAALDETAARLTAAAAGTVSVPASIVLISGPRAWTFVLLLVVVAPISRCIITA